MRRLSAALAALTLAFGGVLIGALPASADEPAGEPYAATDTPAVDPAPVAEEPSSPADEPAPVEPAPIEPAPIEPPAAEPSTDPAPTDPAPTDPTLPTEPSNPSNPPDVVQTAPTAAPSFFPAGVTFLAAPGTGASFVATTLFFVADDGSFQLAELCPRQEAPDSTGAGPFAHAESGILACFYANLTPGTWRVETIQDAGDGRTVSDLSDGDYFVIPETPTVVRAVQAADGAVTISGVGASGDAIHLIDEASAAICDAIVDPSGVWSCVSTGPVTGGLVAVAENTAPGVPDPSGATYHPGGLSALSAVEAVVPAPPPAAPPIALDPNWTFTLDGINLDNIRPGDTFSIGGKNLPPGLDVTVELHSTPVTLATTKVVSDGTFSARATIPLNTPPGVHRIVVILSGAGITPATKEALVTVAPTFVPALALATTAVAEVATTVVETSAEVPAVEEAPTEEHGDESGGHESKPSAIDEAAELAPNILTEALEPIQKVFAEPAVVASAFAIGLVLIIFATVPAHLLNATISEQYQRFSGRLARVRRPRWWERLTAWLARESGVGAVVLVAVTAILFGFADPHFGFNDHSLRLILALAIGLFFIAFVSSWITGFILKQRWRVTTMISVRPLGIILTLLGVIASRVLEFSPGFLIGLVLGLSMSSRSIKDYAWRAVAIRSSIIIVFGIAAWVGYSMLTVHGEPHDFLGALLVETFVAITTEGIVMLLVDLLPFKLLEGERLWAHSKVLWGVIYMVVTMVFIIGVVAWEGNWRELGEALWLWIAVLGIFGLLCVGTYLYFRFFATPLPEEEKDEEEPLARVE